MITSQQASIQAFVLKDDGQFPNSRLPVLLYKNALHLPPLVPALMVKQLFTQHGWHNAWIDGIYTYQHYHSVTHEVIGVVNGSTELQLGGPQGEIILLERGDVLVLPAGVAHKNLCEENDVRCVGAYPNGMEYDMKHGRSDERPTADNNIQLVPMPQTDPVFGKNGPLISYWQ